MLKLLKSCARVTASRLEMALTVLGVVMLLSFPAHASHRFAPHFRANEIRRSIVRHSVVAAPEVDAARTIARIDTEPAIPVPVIAESAARPAVAFEFPAQISLIDLLQRFKLGPSRSSGPDPLL